MADQKLEVEQKMEPKQLFKRTLYDINKYPRTAGVVLLDETYDKIGQVPGLKTNLFLHQQTAIKAMIDLENSVIIPFNNHKIRVTSGILSEPVGSGKTIDILSVILLQKTKLYRTITESRNVIWFKKYKYVISSTLIFVASSVLNQWVEAIEKFTDLTYFVVSGINELTELLDIIYSKAVNKYDIILIKNGTITRLPYNFHNCYDYENNAILKNNKDDTLSSSLSKVKPFIYSVISSLCNVCWNRVVIDDFDVIKLPKDAEVINSSFTWYISSTIKKSSCIEQSTYYYIKDTTSLLLNYATQCQKILRTGEIYNNFNIRNKLEFIQSSNELSTPLYFIHNVPNKDDKLIKALADLNIPEMSVVADMLNADAIGDAAEKIGIKTTNVIDIFEHILGEQYKLFKTAIEILNFIKSQKEKNFTSLPSASKNTYNKSDLLNFKEIEFNYSGIRAFLDKYEEKYLEIRKSSSNIIERVRSNLQEGECPICANDLNDEKEDIIIFKCCNAVICGKCCFGVIFKKNQYFSACANCRAPINIKELVYLNNLDFNYDKLLDQFNEKNVDSVILSNSELLENDTEEVKIEEIKITKFSTIIDILKSSHKGKQIDINIKNVMIGPNNTEISNKKKILIFGSYDGPLEELLNSITELNFKFLFLRGTYRQLAATSKEFNESTENCLLFINSMNHCSGLNLQTASELIFTHLNTDSNIESQVIGRAQRLYRKDRLQVHYILYENELERMDFKYIHEQN